VIALPGSRSTSHGVGLPIGVVAIAVLGLLATVLLVLAPAVRVEQAAAASAVGSVHGEHPPVGVAADALQASVRTGVDVNVLLAAAYVESHWGQAARQVPDATARQWLGDLVGDVDLAALAPGGAVAAEVNRPAGVALGDWVDPQAVGAEHAVGFMQLLPSTWHAYAGGRARPEGGPWDPYRPLDAMTLAGYTFHDLLQARDLAGAFDSYGSGPEALAAYRELVRTASPAAIAQVGVHPAAHASRAGAPGVVVEVRLDGPALADVPAGGYPTRGYDFGECTWWVAFNRQVPPNMGNGDRWVAGAIARGFPVSGQPVVGAIVGYRAGAWGELGHVALVIATGPVHFDVSEMNVIDTEQGTGRVDERRNLWPDPDVQGFIL
jgi:hypothetical protein